MTRRLMATLALALAAGGCGTFPRSAPEPAPGPEPVAPPVPAITVRSISELLDAETRTMRGKTHVHLRVEVPSTSGEPGYLEAGIRAETPVPAASLIKVPIMIAAEQQWHDGTLKRDPADFERVRKMITRSDNAAADQMLSRLGMERVNRWLSEHGYSQTRVRHTMLGRRTGRPNEVTATEMTEMLFAIAEGRLVSPAASREMRELLLAQTRRKRIPAGVPVAALVGNKTGTLRGLVHDVAFVEPPGGPRYALAVLIEDAGPEERAEAAIASLSEAVYRFLAAP